MRIILERNHWKTRIPLSQGKYAIVDRKSYDYLNQWKWHLHSSGYAVRREHIRLAKDSYKGRYIYMHRLIMENPKGMVIDHINGDGLDNRKRNLRVCTQAQNLVNRGVQPNSVTGVKGVRWNKHKNRFEPNITVNGKKVYIGRFKTIEEAAQAYKEASIKYFGEYTHASVKHR